MGALVEGNLDPFTVGTHGAASTNTLHLGVVATAATVTGVAVVQSVALLARLGAEIRALEDAGVHVRLALGSLHADVAAVHVDVAGDIESAPLTEGDLGPGVVDTTEHGELASGCGRSAGSRDVLGEGQLDGLALLHSDGNVGLELVDGHASVAIGLPAVEDSIGVAVVGDLHTPLAVTSNPDTAVVGLVVLANLCAERTGDAGNAGKDVVNNVADGVAGVALG